MSKETGPAASVPNQNQARQPSPVGPPAAAPAGPPLGTPTGPRGASGSGCSASPSQPSPVGPRTKWSYGIGCIGRDAVYTLVNTFLITYLTLAVGLSNWQLAAVGVVMIIARVWDAVNDPMMGTIINNTRGRWGKFKPYIICGAVLNSFFTILLFSIPNNNEMLFILIFAFTYILWGMTYTMNDISYWSMLPSLTTDPKEREKVTSLARIGANIGLFVVTAAVPAITAGGMGSLYRPIAIAVAVAFIACQLLVVLGVRENKSAVTGADSGNLSLRQMVKIVAHNDQLLAIAGAILLFNTGYFITTGFGVQFFYFDYGNFGGMEFTLFAITIGVTQIVTLALYPLISKRFTRRQLFGGATVAVLIGYLGLMSVKYLLPMTMPVICAIGFVLFAGQAVIQLLNYVLLADTVEYGQWKLGTRNEGIIYSLNPFITKLASAVQAGVFSLTLIVSGLNATSNRISALESEMEALGEGTEAVRAAMVEEGNRIVAGIPGSATLILRCSMIILPMLLIIACYFVYRKKYVIDEKMYQEILTDLEARAKTEGADHEE